jgi:hypothetical protein
MSANINTIVAIASKYSSEAAEAAKYEWDFWMAESGDEETAAEAAANYVADYVADNDDDIEQLYS